MFANLSPVCLDGAQGILVSPECWLNLSPVCLDGAQGILVSPECLLISALSVLMVLKAFLSPLRVGLILPCVCLDGAQGILVSPECWLNLTLCLS